MWSSDILLFLIGRQASDFLELFALETILKAKLRRIPDLTGCISFFGIMHETFWVDLFTDDSCGEKVKWLLEYV